MIELILGLLRTIFGAAIEAAGEQAARDACDDVCKIRRGFETQDARADAKFGPKRCTACGQVVATIAIPGLNSPIGATGAPPDSVPPTDPSPLPEGYVR